MPDQLPENELIAKIKEYVKLGQIPEALQGLEKLPGAPNFKNEVTLLSSQYSILLLNERRGTESRDELDVKRNRLLRSLLDLLEDRNSLLSQKVETGSAELTIAALRARSRELLTAEFENTRGHFFKKYIDQVFKERPEAEKAFGRFVEQKDRRCYVLTGRAGKGKTVLFCNLALLQTKSNSKGLIPLLLNSPDLRLDDNNLKSIVEQAFWGVSLEKISRVLVESNERLVVFIDALNELEGKDVFNVFNNQLTALIEEIEEKRLPLLFCLSCRSDFWYLFEQSDWALKRVFNAERGLDGRPTIELRNFPEDKMDEILERYFYWFGLEGKERIRGRAKEQCRDPLMLRYFCESYTFRPSNDREMPPEQLKKQPIEVTYYLRRKKVFDRFVKNIRERMYDRVTKAKSIAIRREKLEEVTSRYLINLAWCMQENSRAHITLEEARSVAEKLNHEDAKLSEYEFFSPKSIFFMFVDEGVVLDKHHKRNYYFVFESYFEYSLGRYIAYERWPRLFAEEPVEERIKEDLQTLLDQHFAAQKGIKPFTNLLGAIQYAILVTEDDPIYKDYPLLFLELIKVMMSGERETNRLIQKQKALSILRATTLLSEPSGAPETRKMIQRLLSILRDFTQNAEDFVIHEDVVPTLHNLGKSYPPIVISKMEEWAEKKGRSVVLQLCATQVIARLAAEELETVIQVISNLLAREDYRRSFWLSRTLLHAISEIVKSGLLAESPKGLRQLWELCLGLIQDERTPIYSRDLSFSLLPLIAGEEEEYTNQILELRKAAPLSIWGTWNLVYELREWSKYGFTDSASWVWQLLEDVQAEDNPHLTYAVYEAVKGMGKNGALPGKGKEIFSQARENQWIRPKIHRLRGRPLSREKRNKTGIVYSPIYLEPAYDNHTECRQRLQAIVSKLIAIGEEHYNWVLPLEPQLDQLQSVHSAKNDRRRHGAVWDTYLEEVMDASDMMQKGIIKRRQSIDPAELRHESFEVAKISAGGVISAVDYVMNNDANSAWSLGRPPGHLANNAICILNNIAIGAEHAREAYGIHRILIIDCDAHHGMHTGRVFRDNPSVIYFSIHIDIDYSHEEGKIERDGVGTGKGYTFNILYPPNTDDRGYKYIVDNLLEPLAVEFEPELIMVSAGFDGHWEDELNPNNQFTEQAFIDLAQTIRNVSSKLGIKVVGAFEGGYGLDSLANSFVHMMNVIGDWGLPHEAIGFVEGAPEKNRDAELEEVKKNVRRRVEIMRATKESNPDYQLFNHAANWDHLLH